MAGAHSRIDGLSEATVESNSEPLLLTGRIRLPLYEYRCTKCGHRFERLQQFSDPPPKKCPECGGKVEQMVSAPAVQFKGSGWYVTDYARKSGAPAGCDAKSSDVKAGESKSAESKPGESKPAEKSESKNEPSGKPARKDKK